MSRIAPLALLLLLGCSDQSLYTVPRAAPAEVAPAGVDLTPPGAFEDRAPSEPPVGDDDDTPADLDGDGFTAEDDCDDDDPDVYPGAIEQCRSGKDEDCLPETNCDDLCLAEFDFGQCGAAGQTPTPTVHWSYDDVVDGTVFGEGSRGVDGAVSGAPVFQPGLVGDAASFDGETWIFAPAPVALPSNAFTLATWVRLRAADNPGPYDFLMSNGNGDPAFTGASMFVGGSTPSSLLEGGQAALETMIPGPQICEDGWAHVVVRFDAGTTITSVDGHGVESSTPFTDVVWGARTFGVGQDPNNLTRGFVGQLDETMVWGEAVADVDLESLRRDTICGR